MADENVGLDNIVNIYVLYDTLLLLFKNILKILIVIS